MRTEHRDGVDWLYLDNPERLNAFTAPDYLDVSTAVEEAVGNPATGAIVLTGTGRAFSAGADRSLVDGTATEEEREIAGEAFFGMLDVLGRCEKPVFAAVNGLAVGIGCTVLLHCDLVLVAESARLRLPFTALGLVPEAGSSALLPARARWSDTLWAMLSSEWIDAPTALAMGLAWRVIPDDQLLEETARAAAVVAALDPAAVMATKRLLNAGRADVVAAAMAREGAEMQTLFSRRG